MPESYNLYHGIFKGTVLGNDDPENLCRLQIHVPEIHGPRAPAKNYPWALACAPLGGGYSTTNNCGYGFVFIPPVNSTVWVMFEHGVLDKPVWIGSPFTNSQSQSPETPKQSINPDSDTGAEYPNIFLIKPLSLVDESTYIKFCYNPTSKSYKISVVLDANGGLDMVSTYNSGTRTYQNNVTLTSNSTLNINVTASQVNQGALNLTSTGNITLSAPNITLNSTTQTILSGKNIEVSSVGGDITFSVDNTHALVADAKNVMGFNNGN